MPYFQSMLEPLFAGAILLSRCPGQAHPCRARPNAQASGFGNENGSRKRGGTSTDQHECLERCAKAQNYMERSLNQILSQSREPHGARAEFGIPGHQVARAETSPG